MKKLNKKGLQLGDLSGIAITFVVLAVVLGVGATILDSIQAGQTSGTTAYNATGEGLTALGDFAGWLPTLAVIVVAAVVIGTIAFFYRRD